MPSVVADGDRSVPRAEVRILLEDRVELPRLYLAWRSPHLFGEGDAGMDLLGEVLAGGKTSRLYRALVLERQLATDVSAAQGSREIDGWFCISATAAPGRELAELEEVISGELNNLADAGPEEVELKRGITQIEAQFVYSLQTVGGFNGRSDQLNAYNVYTGDPGFMIQDRARYREATVGDLRDLTASQLLAERRVALSVVPTGAADRALAGSVRMEVS